MVEGGAVVNSGRAAGGRDDGPTDSLWCAGVQLHLGLLPQSVINSAVIAIKARTTLAQPSFAPMRGVQDAGASLLVLECVPAELAAALSAELLIPVIGIGAGNRCDGQVLVLHDMLGLTPGRPPRSAETSWTPAAVSEAVAAYVAAVRSGAFPGPEHTLFWVDVRSGPSGCRPSSRSPPCARRLPIGAGNVAGGLVPTMGTCMPGTSSWCRGI